MLFRKERVELLHFEKQLRYFPLQSQSVQWRSNLDEDERNGTVAPNVSRDRVRSNWRSNLDWDERNGTVALDVSSDRVRVITKSLEQINVLPVFADIIVASPHDIASIGLFI